MKASKGEKFLWLIAGLGLGTGITFLFATTEGRRVRRDLWRLAKESGERITEGGQEVLEKGKQVYERGKEVVDEAMEFVERGRRFVRR